MKPRKTNRSKKTNFRKSSNHATQRMAEYERLARALQLTSEELDVWLFGKTRCSKRAFGGALKSGRFAATVERLSSLHAHALRVFVQQDHVAKWFQTPLRALDSKTPLEYCRSSLSARELGQLLGRIEHGVYS